MNVPLQRLPFAAATLDRDRVIVAANHAFHRLCAHADADCSGQRLEDLVAGRDRSALAEALDLLALEAQAPPACSIMALRAKPPSLWLAINVTRLGPESPVPYLVCLQAVPRRRQNDGPPQPRTQARAERSRPTRPDLTPSSVEREQQPWPPALMTFAHEVRGPLLAIRGWAQLAERGVAAPETVSRALAVIGRNASSLSQMIDDLFDLSRRTGSLALKRERIDLNPLAQLVVESTLPAARERDVMLTVRRSSRTLPVTGDALRIEQVLRNLVENAIKFTATGGRVRVSTRCDGSFAELVVTDNGPGISPDLLPVIFEPFRHDDDAVSASARGLGLGLAIVRELVQLHGGDVRALSGGRGHGSTFVVRLPLANSAVSACA